MPELPEVETVRRGLAPVMEGARFDKVRGASRRPALAAAEGFRQAHRGHHCHRPGPPRQISAGRPVVRRRAADASRHVGLVPRRAKRRRPKTPGRYYHERSKQSAHDHVVFQMSSGAMVSFNDPRRFGSMKLVPRARLDEEPLLRSLGPEPLGNEFDAAMLAEACHGKKTSLKAALLDQTIVAGLGNIYVCEALNRSRLSPRRIASTLATRSRRAARAHRAAGRFHQGGAQRRDQGRRLVVARPSPDLGRARHFQHNFRVYDREGKPCPTRGCGGTIRRIAQNGRSTFYLSGCARNSASLHRMLRRGETDQPCRPASSSKPKAGSASSASTGRRCSTRSTQRWSRSSTPRSTAFDADANIGCILITGSEKAFAAGADIKEMADKELHRRLPQQFRRQRGPHRARPQAGGRGGRGLRARRRLRVRDAVPTSSSPPTTPSSASRRSSSASFPAMAARSG